MKNKGKFLVAKYSLRPKHKRVNTAQKGWMNDPANIAWDEQVGFIEKLKVKDYQEWNVILDLSNKKLLVCRVPTNAEQWQEQPSFDVVYNYFYKNYQRQLDIFNPSSVSVDS